jgi:hypothetical protein
MIFPLDASEPKGRGHKFVSVTYKIHITSDGSMAWDSDPIHII